MFDGAAYLKSERAFKDLLRDNNCPTAAVQATRYDGVILLTSLAVDKPEKYDDNKGTNKARQEDAQQAAKADAETEKAWRKYFDEERIKVHAIREGI